ncbi:MAG: flagellar basal body L-ring protein FlgH, partial [Desulfobacula sp.]|nr:flagellar basal body L-ring protein FlgH [Desulfobacula sp.]
MVLKLKTICIFIVLIVCLNFTGCSLFTKTNNAGLTIPEGGSSQPSIQPQFTGARPSEGSLWVNKNGSMYEDSKAAHIGDTIIVDIIENTSSQMDVNTEGSRNTKMNIG